MLKVGITGGIGSGKSLVARLFGILGVPVFQADTEARKMMEEDPVIRQKLTEMFGSDTFVEGRLNRAHLSARVFGNPPLLAQLNELVHPAILERADRWMREQTTPYALKEAALIFESGGQRYLDVVIGVYAPEALRIARVMRRDGIDRQAVKDRMKNQLEESLKMRLCDHVIRNTEQELLIPQVLELHQRLRALGQA
jgi:dephospho-CoA kinase